MVDINKIRNNELTEDEKMELIADYLEQGGGGGSSDEVVLNIRNLVAPTDMSQLADTRDLVAKVYQTAEFTVEDSKGGALTGRDIIDAVKNGKHVIMGELPYQGGFPQHLSGDEIESILEVGRYKRLSTNMAVLSSEDTPGIPEGEVAILLSGVTVSMDGDHRWALPWTLYIVSSPDLFPGSNEDGFLLEISFPS